jgi:hypothetical protein
MLLEVVLVLVQAVVAPVQQVYQPGTEHQQLR